MVLCLPEKGRILDINYSFIELSRVLTGESIKIARATNLNNDQRLIVAQNCFPTYNLHLLQNGKHSTHI